MKTLANKKTVRILHVVGGMVRAGTETWLMHILRHIDKERFQIDFLVNTTHTCAYDDEIRTLGSRIIPCPGLSRPWLYASNLKRILHHYGPYDIVHSHVHHFSGLVLYIAQQAGVPVRIAHSHLDSSSTEVSTTLPRRFYIALMKSLIAHYATVGLGCSQEAAADLFGSNWKTNSHQQILYCGIDLTLFQNKLDSRKLRDELGIPTDAFVIGHVGRFEPQKNHKFLLEIVAEIAKKETNIRLLLIGKGTLLPKVEQQMIELNLADKVILTGVRADICRLMLSAMDVFLLPSLYEGLPVVGLEAQAAGLPLILSNTVSKELDKVDYLIKRLSLSQSASVWAEAVLATRNTKSKISQSDCIKILEKSQFNITYSNNILTRIYEQEYFKSY